MGLRKWVRYFIVKTGGENPAEETVTPLSEEDIRRNNYDQLRKLQETHWQNLSKAANKMDDDVELFNKISYHKELHCQICRKLGELDGAAATRDINFHSTSLIQSAEINGQVVAFLRGRVGKQVSLIMDKEQKRLSVEERFKKYSEGIGDIEKLKYKERSYILFGFFSIFSLGMILADIVISVNLVSYFGIGSVKSNAKLIKRLTDPDLLLFSLGITFCTVYFKVLYDDYIIGQPGQGYSQYRENLQKGGAGLFYWGDWGIKLIIKLAIGFFLLLMLHSLSEFRMTITIGLEENETIRELIKGNPGLKQILLRCFQGITILIPLIGGVCLSLAMQIWNNRRNLGKLNKQKMLAEDELKAITQELEIFTVRRLQFQSHLDEWTGNEKKVELLAEVFTANYNQGYKIGYRVKYGNDFYTMIEEKRNELFCHQLDKMLMK